MNLKNYNLPCCFITVIMSYSATGAEGDIVTVPSYQLGLPDSNYLTVDDMVTQGMGTNQDGNIISKLQSSLVGKDPNDLMHWYVTTPTAGQTVECSGNSFRLTYATQNDAYTAAVMVVWLPAPAKEINVSFESYSRGLSLAVYTYDYHNNSVMTHWEENNVFNNPKAPNTSVTFEKTITPGRDPNKKGNKPYDAFTGNYLLLLFNTTEKEQTWLDINGIGVSFVPEYPIAATSDFEINPFNLDVGNNIMMLPEPTTTTLSLAALCMLAARRRRR